MVWAEFFFLKDGAHSKCFMVWTTFQVMMGFVRALLSLGERFQPEATMTCVSEAGLLKLFQVASVLLGYLYLEFALLFLIMYAKKRSCYLKKEKKERNI